MSTSSAVAVLAKPISAPSHPRTIASQMNVSLPVMMPSLRGSARAVAIVSTVFVVSNDASLSPMISGIAASRSSVSGGKSGPNALGNWNAISGRPTPSAIALWYA